MAGAGWFKKFLLNRRRFLCDSTGEKKAAGLLLLPVILLRKFDNAVAMNNGGITWQKSMLDLYFVRAAGTFESPYRCPLFDFSIELCGDRISAIRNCRWYPVHVEFPPEIDRLRFAAFNWLLSCFLEKPQLSIQFSNFSLFVTGDPLIYICFTCYFRCVSWGVMFFFLFLFTQKSREWLVLWNLIGLETRSFSDSAIRRITNNWW